MLDQITIITTSLSRQTPPKTPTTSNMAAVEVQSPVPALKEEQVPANKEEQVPAHKELLRFGQPVKTDLN